MGQWGLNQWNSFNFPWNPCLLIGMTEMMDPQLWEIMGPIRKLQSSTAPRSWNPAVVSLPSDADVKQASNGLAKGSSLVPVSWYFFRCTCVSGINSPGKSYGNHMVFLWFFVGVFQQENPWKSLCVFHVFLPQSRQGNVHEDEHGMLSSAQQEEPLFSGGFW